MIIINKQEITLTKGDSGFIRFIPIYDDKSLYELQPSDRVVFRLKLRETTVFEKDCSIEPTDNLARLLLEPSDTENLNPGTYYYEVELIDGYNHHFTFIAYQRFTIGKEIELHKSSTIPSGVMTDKTGDNGGPVVQSLVSIFGEVQKIGGVTVGVVVHTTEEWRTTYGGSLSIEGCWYVYSDYRQETVDGNIIYIPRTKIGDGSSIINDLPFATLSLTENDVAKWNDHVGMVVDDEHHRIKFYH